MSFNPYAPPEQLAPQPKQSTAMLYYVGAHLAQVLGSVAWVYFNSDPMLGTQNPLLLNMCQVAYATNGLFLLIGFWMVATTFRRTGVIWWWLADAVISVVVFMMGAYAS